MRTMIIDDGVDLSDTLDSLLRAYAFTIVSKCYDGKEAIDLYLQLKPELVLLDIMMPDYDGFYTINQIRRTDPAANIIVITGDVRPETSQKLNELNIPVLQKPFEIKELLQIVDKKKKKNMLKKMEFLFLMVVNF